jgi:putative metallohydrolase (TIGR04338 family)
VSRSAVYAAEDQWSAVLDRGGVVNFFGSRIDVPVQRRFGDIAAMVRYVDGVLALGSVRSRFPDVPAVRVRERAGQAKAHYEPDTRTIAVPVKVRWAAREAVILHELSHHLTSTGDRGAVRPSDSGADWHGPIYRTTMVDLVCLVLGEQAALLLRAGYEANGVPVEVAR